MDLAVAVPSKDRFHTDAQDMRSMSENVSVARWSSIDALTKSARSLVLIFTN